MKAVKAVKVAKAPRFKDRMPEVELSDLEPDETCVVVRTTETQVPGLIEPAVDLTRQRDAAVRSGRNEVMNRFVLFFIWGQSIQPHHRSRWMKVTRTRSN